MPEKSIWAPYGHRWRSHRPNSGCRYNERGAVAAISQSIAACTSSVFATMSLGGTVRATFQNILKYFVTSALARLPRDVRFTPKSGHVQCNEGCPLSATSRHLRMTGAKQKDRLAAISTIRSSQPIVGSPETNRTRSHRQAEAFSCLAFAISSLPPASLIFSFALPRLQRAKAELGSSRSTSL